MRKIFCFSLLCISALALWGFIHSVIDLSHAFEFSRRGVQTRGWITGKNEVDQSIYYAYSAKDQTYGGHYTLNKDDSDFYYTNVGDSVNVVYSEGRPYASMVGDDPKASLMIAEFFLILWVVMLCGSTWLLTFLVKRRRRAQSSGIMSIASPTYKAN
jgi:hypothetical protein